MHNKCAMWLMYRLFHVNCNNDVLCWAIFHYIIINYINMHNLLSSNKYCKCHCSTDSFCLIHTIKILCNLMQCYYVYKFDNYFWLQSCFLYMYVLTSFCSEYNLFSLSIINCVTNNLLLLRHFVFCSFLFYLTATLIENMQKIVILSFDAFIFTL